MTELQHAVCWRNRSSGRHITGHDLKLPTPSDLSTYTICRSAIKQQLIHSVIPAGSEELQQLAEKLEKTTANYGMEINSNKSKIPINSINIRFLQSIIIIVIIIVTEGLRKLSYYLCEEIWKCSEQKTFEQ